MTNIKKNKNINNSKYAFYPESGTTTAKSMFPEKLAKTNEMMRISGMPNIELLTQKKEANQNSDVILKNLDLPIEPLNGKISNKVGKVKKTGVLPKLLQNVRCRKK
jgi:hypothetical protein